MYVLSERLVAVQGVVASVADRLNWIDSQHSLSILMSCVMHYTHELVHACVDVARCCVAL